MSQKLQFALCADDYAIAPGVSRGIREAMEAGAITATSVMTNMPHWPAGAPALRALAGRADIGVHLNLTAGRPLGPMPLLAPTGCLPPLGRIFGLAGRGRLPLTEVAAEIDRQLDAFVAQFGLPPDHVDGHQHVHVIAPIRRLLFAALRSRGWTPWIRNSGDRPWRIAGRRLAAGKALVVAALAQGLASGATAAGLRTNDGFAGYSGFEDREDVSHLFASFLAAPGRRHLVMCHPGHVDDELKALDPVLASREQELAYLLSPAFKRDIGNRGASLARLSQLI